MPIDSWNSNRSLLLYSLDVNILPYVVINIDNIHVSMFFCSTWFQFDLAVSLGTAADLGVDGPIIWGNNYRKDPKSQCEREKIYLETKLGPYVNKLLDFFMKCSHDLCSSNGRCVKNKVEVDAMKINSDLDEDHVYSLDYVQRLAVSLPLLWRLDGRGLLRHCMIWVNWCSQIKPALHIKAAYCHCPLYCEQGPFYQRRSLIPTLICNYMPIMYRMKQHYLCIPKLQRLHRWSLGMEYFCPTLYRLC